MKVGITYELREQFPIPEGAPDDYTAEFLSESYLAGVEAALLSLGYEVLRIGHARDLLDLLHDDPHVVDCIFNQSEGMGGRARAAQVPAILEAYGIPYVFSDPLTQALTLDKALTKQVWLQVGLPTAAFVVAASAAEIIRLRDQSPDYPLFVKPRHEGSSKGISQASIVDSEAALCQSVEQIHLKYHQAALVEPFLPGREYTLAILGSGPDARVLEMSEITEVQIAKVSGYLEKEEWHTLYPDTFEPVRDEALRETLSDLALKAYRAVDCWDTGRVDLRVDADGQPQLLEINALPGLHPTHAALPILANRAGLSYEDLIDQIMTQAQRRWQSK